MSVTHPEDRRARRDPTGHELVGSWALVSSLRQRDGVPTPTFGTPPAGQILYAADGRMSAFLMDPAWAARGQAGAEGFSDFLAYAGSWTLEDDTIRHRLAFCSAPTLIGSELVRMVRWVDADTLELVTRPDLSRSGAAYVTHLVWRRIGANGRL